MANAPEQYSKQSFIHSIYSAWELKGLLAFWVRIR